MALRSTFWSICFPLGQIATSMLEKEKPTRTIQLIDSFFLSNTELKEAMEQCDRRLVVEEYKFMAYLVERNNVVLPSQECLHLWVAHQSLFGLVVDSRISNAVCYYSLIQLKEKMKRRYESSVL